jgi:DNA-directed RNA polymerase specialized sigma24 family protein
MKRIFSLCCWMTGSSDFARETVWAAAGHADPLAYAVNACLKSGAPSSEREGDSSLLAALRRMAPEQAMTLLLLDRLHVPLTQGAKLMGMAPDRLRTLHKRARRALADQVA